MEVGRRRRMDNGAKVYREERSIQMKGIMKQIISKIFRSERVHLIPRLPVCMELSDGDRAMLYGWPDKTVEEILGVQA